MSRTEGPVSKLISKMEDITLKTRAIDEAPFGITIADMRKEDDPLIYVNDGFERLTGYAEGEILGQNCRFLQGPGTNSEPVDRMREGIENSESVQVELRNYRKDGTEFWCEVTLAPIENQQGEITHYVGFQQDVSKRKEYETQLEKQRDDLRLLNEMVRHDIRNDLQIALASMELLQVQNQTDGEGHEQISTAIESIHQAIGLTNVARDVADVMLDTGGSYRPVDIAPVLEDEIQECRASYPDATVSIGGTLPQVRVEANELLSSVFRNLLTNAVHHNDSEAPEVRVSAAVGDEQVFVTVADNGPGIPDAARDKLFERGWTDDSTTGTGIGLYLVHRLLENYGGEIRLLEDGETPDRSEADEIALGGATFVVSLPRAE